MLLLDQIAAQRNHRQHAEQSAAHGVITSYSIHYTKLYEALKRIDQNGFGIGITTKSTLIERDIDLLVQIAKHSPVIVKITVTTSDDSLCKVIEPNVAVTSERIRVIKVV